MFLSRKYGSILFLVLIYHHKPIILTTHLFLWYIPQADDESRNSLFHLLQLNSLHPLNPLCRSAMSQHSLKGLSNSLPFLGEGDQERSLQSEMSSPLLKATLQGRR